MKAHKQGRARLCALALALAFAALFAPAKALAASPAAALAALNSQRAVNGIPGDIVENPDWSVACAAHTAYMDANSIFATHDEDPSKPGFTEQGAWAGQHSVSGGTADGPAAGDGPTGYEWAPIHLAQLLGPGLAVSGYADRCTITWPGYTRPAPAAMETFSYPGPGTSIYPAMVANEGPHVPGDFVGLPNGTMTGPHLYVFAFGQTVNGATLSDATLTGPRGAVDVRAADNGTSGIAGLIPPGGIIIPVAPLVPGAYTARVAVTPNDGQRPSGA